MDSDVSVDHKVTIDKKTLNIPTLCVGSWNWRCCLAMAMSQSNHICLMIFTQSLQCFYNVKC